MRSITENYINGAFVPSSGTEEAPLFNPATEEQIGVVRLSGAKDVDDAVAAAKDAFPVISSLMPGKRADLLRRLAAAVERKGNELVEAMRDEYGAPAPFVEYSARRSNSVFLDMASIIEDFAWTRRIGNAEVEMLPVGIAAAITPWNSNYGFICAKLAAALAAGTSIVVKPSEMSAIQTQVLLEALHEADLPPGVFNVVNGTGGVVGEALTRHRDIAKITFTGSTTSGRAILHAAADTMKRVTLELGGKGAQIILDDVDARSAAALALSRGFINSGQACIAGTRILVPRSRLDEIQEHLTQALGEWKVGPGSDPSSKIGPMVSRKQWDRVQSYIDLGIAEGAKVLAGGPGRPDHRERGWFVRPTLLGHVDNGMRVAREEIFGPVLCVIPYEDDDDAVSIANDTDYGLQNVVIGRDEERAKRVGRRLISGRVIINEGQHEPQAPFGGFKQSGIGREFGTFGLEAFLEPRTMLL